MATSVRSWPLSITVACHTETVMPSKKRPTLKFIHPVDIRDYRSKHRLSQTEFWSRIGVTQSGGSRYETGRDIPLPVQLLVQLAYGTPQEATALLSWLRDVGRATLEEGSDSAMTIEQNDELGR